MDIRTTFQHNGRLAVVLAVVFGLPLPVLSVVSGLNPTVAVVLFAAVTGSAIVLMRFVGRGPVEWSQRVSPPRAVVSAILALVLVSLLIQLVPYGRSHDNPPVVAEPAWDSERTRQLTVKACFDCHSNEVAYPWYADVAPISWALQSHIDAGRDDLNFSEWDRPQKEAHESAETVEEGSMPPWYYTLVRPGLLSDAETQDLISGLEATLGTERSDDETEDDDDD